MTHNTQNTLGGRKPSVLTHTEHIVRRGFRSCILLECFSLAGAAKFVRADTKMGGVKCRINIEENM